MVFPTSRQAFVVVGQAFVIIGLASTLVIAGCQSAPRSRADAATAAACRAEVDRVYAAQNRAELSRRDQRDTPFAGSYNSGITSRGLGSLFGRDNQVSSCVDGSSGPNAGAATVDTGTGPTFSPTAR